MNPFRLTTRLAAASREVAQRRTELHTVAQANAAEYGSRQPAGASVASAASVASKPVVVPWQVVRRSVSGLEVVNTGPVPLRAARFSLAGSGLLGLSLPRTVHPGERLRVVLRGAQASGVSESPDAMLTLRWFQPDGTELLWPIAL